MPVFMQGSTSAYLLLQENAERDYNVTSDKRPWACY
jgi:hypothetical protein